MPMIPKYDNILATRLYVLSIVTVYLKMIKNNCGWLIFTPYLIITSTDKFYCLADKCQKWDLYFDRAENVMQHLVFISLLFV